VVSEQQAKIDVKCPVRILHGMQVTGG
jgi:hypothetical protein